MNEESVGFLILGLLASHFSSSDAYKCTSEPYIENIFGLVGGLYCPPPNLCRLCTDSTESVDCPRTKDRLFLAGGPAKFPIPSPDLVHRQC